MRGTDTASFEAALPGGAAPDWVHLLPPGRMDARDGRRFDLADPEAILRDFEARAVDLPVDFEHQTESAVQSRSGPVPVAGWIKKLAIRDTGLWGRVEWTDRARRLIEAKEYRYISPTIIFRKTDGRILRLKGAGLVHHPALHLTALAREETDMDPTRLITEIAEMLGVEDPGDGQAILDALARLTASRETAAEGGTPDPARFVPVEAVQDLLQERNQSLARMAEERAGQRVEAALAAGYISPAMRGWATALCQRDEASFDAFLAASTPQFAGLFRQAVPSAPPQSREQTEDDATAAAICAQLGLPPGALAR